MRLSKYFLYASGRTLFRRNFKDKSISTFESISKQIWETSPSLFFYDSLDRPITYKEAKKRFPKAFVKIPE